MEKRTDVREKRQIYIYIYVYIQWLGVEDLEFCNFGIRNIVVENCELF